MASASNIEIKFEVVQTTKNKDAILAQNFVYNFKHANKDDSKHYVCNNTGCYSSLTVLNSEVKKVNGKKIVSPDLNLTHTKHGPYRDEDIIGMNFVKVMKS